MRYLLFIGIMLSLGTTIPVQQSYAINLERQISVRSIQDVGLFQEWFPFSGYVGEVAAARRFAKREGIRLRIVPGSESLDPIKLVLSGSADFGVVSGDLLISAVAKGAPIIAIGMVNYTSPTCFIVRNNSGIKGPRDFIGKRVGILLGTNTERIYAIMMNRAGIDRSRVVEIPVPFDLQTFILGQYDVRPAFIYDEPVSLDFKSIRYRLILPEQYGVRFVGTVYFTRRDVLQQRRDVAQKLINALKDGWNFALHEPEVAIKDLLNKYPDLNSERELRSWKAGMRYFVDPQGRALMGTNENWENTIRGLEEIGVLEKKLVRVEQVWDNTLVRSAYGK
jgi:NitT/TauT family transport system substrate-binding protein